MRVRLEILGGGKVLPTVHHAGKIYLPVPEVGAEYTVRVCNDGPRRVVAIVSVDGLSVLNGKPASEEHPGYIVAPHSSVVIPGWRRSMNSVAAFRFVERDKSYAARVGRPENVGVIGLVAFEEQLGRPILLREREGFGAAGKRLASPGRVGSVGTEYGREIDSRIVYVDFVRSNNRRAVTVYYDTVSALRDAGVPVDGPSPVPFPGDGGFVPPPPRYTGK
jgi:hypothetical protein